MIFLIIGIELSKLPLASLRQSQIHQEPATMVQSIKMEYLRPSIILPSIHLYLFSKCIRWWTSKNQLPSYIIIFHAICMYCYITSKAVRHDYIRNRNSSDFLSFLYIPNGRCHHKFNFTIMGCFHFISLPAREIIMA